MVSVLDAASGAGMAAKTLQDYMDEHRGVLPGFDALRLILSVIILLWHTVYACYGRHSAVYDAVWSFPLFQPVLHALLPMFFFLSGFLVTGSAHRVGSARVFFLHRALRIVPALFVEVMLCAVVLGAFLTTFPLSEYFSHHDFWQYFLNIVGVIQYDLPGVFTGSALPTTSVVNINLWTLPSELESYALMIVLMALGVVADRKILIGVMLCAQAFFLLLLPGLDWGSSGTVFVHPRLLIYCFFLGVLCHTCANKIRMNVVFAVLAVCGMAFFLLKYTIILGVLAACYLTLCIGILDLRRFPLVQQGDYSYGIYLYGFPIERALVEIFPAIQHWWQLFLVAMPVTLGFAVASWHFIEKPALRLKKHIKPTRPKVLRNAET